MVDTTPSHDRMRARLMLLGVPSDMLNSNNLRRIVAYSTYTFPPHHLNADELAQIVIAVAERGRLKLPKLRR